ncbi:hypothetical protein DFS34DRAFT_603703 [Phlyctochytrium arcticum]|nr:hypothetical protein DFS34DRAFT_603703 [Phlyctochytrium arcticum]
MSETETNFNSLLKRLKKCLGEGIAGGCPNQPKPKRRIYVNIPLPPMEFDHLGRPHQHFPANKVRTSKYTPITFIPKNLCEQFRRLANLYFLMTVILQVFPMFGVASPILAAMPLMIILTITGIKDGFEDYSRHKTDNKVNNATTFVLAGEWENTNRIKRDTYWFKSPFKAKPCSCAKDSKVISPCPQCKKQMKTSKVSGWSSNKEKSGEIHPFDDMEQNITASNDDKKGWKKIAWKELHVGDFIYLESDNLIPADILVLSTFDPHGLCFVETKGLDGETNLKSREALKDTLGITTAFDCAAAKFIIETEPPSMNLYTYNGSLILPRANSPVRQESQHRRMSRKSLVPAQNIFEEAKTAPINIQNVLLRGTILRNSPWVIGMVISTGLDTKVLLNAGQTPSKRTRIEKLMNPQVGMNFLILLVMCIIIAALDAYHGHKIWNRRDFPQYEGKHRDQPAVSGIYSFWASMIMLQNVVPISLYITLEGVKTIQAYFIYSDVDMYWEPTNESCIPKSWNISDDLGQIEYLFSDKTGTLTQNKMDFLRCTIGGVVYGKGYTDVTAEKAGIDPPTRSRLTSEAVLEMFRSSQEVYKNPYLNPENLTGFVDDTLWNDFTSDPRQAENIRSFFTMLALCHTVLPPNWTGGETTYAAQSPDEQALVTAAKGVGFTFLNRIMDQVQIDILGGVKTYKVLNILEFTSARKRMSVIVRSEVDGKIWLMCKGADSIIYERLSKGQTVVQEQTYSQLESFANEGLRTICLAQREVLESEYVPWAERYHKAACSIADREAELEAISDEIERELILMGATAIEDKLQEQVPECIALLRQAGIKIWVLTGDKLETAINICLASNLLSASQDMIILKAHTEETIMTQLADTIQEYSSRTDISLIIDGDSLRYALATETGRDLLLKLGMKCQSVVCCRVSPKQKAQVVRLVKHGAKAMCASIGDGANDVSMIQEAHVGFGIAGLEGPQAAMAADYVIGQFHFLSKVLLVHGRWSYYRISATVMHFFYKNLVWVFSLFWFQLFCSFSASILFDFTYLMLFNLIFTSLPPLVLGIFDQDVNSHYSLAIPPLYKIGISQSLFTVKRFVLTVLDALYQSAVCFFFPYALFRDASWDVNGYGTDRTGMGTTVAMCVIVTVNCGIGLHIRNWTWMVFLCIIGSVCSFIVYVPIYGAIPSSTIGGVTDRVYANPQFWLCVICTTVVCLLPHLAWGLFTSMVCPSDSEVVRERQKYDLGPPPQYVRVQDMKEMMKGEDVPVDIVRQEAPAKAQAPTYHTAPSESGVGATSILDVSHAVTVNTTVPSEVTPHKVTFAPQPTIQIVESIYTDSEESLGRGGKPRTRPKSAPSVPVLHIRTDGHRAIGTSGQALSARELRHLESPHPNMIFMDSRTVSRNTGFAFSFDEGEATHDAISPFSTVGIAQLLEQELSRSSQDLASDRVNSTRIVLELSATRSPIRSSHALSASEGNLWPSIARPNPR